MKLMGKFESLPKETGLYLVLNQKGYIGVALWERNKWYSLPDKIEITYEFWWINFSENINCNEYNKKDLPSSENIEICKKTLLKLWGME